MYWYVGMIFQCKIVTITRYFIAYAALWWKSVIFFLLSLETVHDRVHYKNCIFPLLYRLLRIRLKRQNPLLSYVQERERERENYTVNVQCSVQYALLLIYLMLVMCYCV